MPIGRDLRWQRHLRTMRRCRRERIERELLRRESSFPVGTAERRFLDQVVDVFRRHPGPSLDRIFQPLFTP